MSKDKLETGFRIWLDDRNGIPADLSGDLVPGSYSGGGKAHEEIDMSGASNPVRSYLGGHASAPVAMRLHANDTSRQALHLLSRMAGRVGTLTAMYGAGGAAPVIGDPIWTGEYVFMNAKLTPDGGRWILEANFNPAKGFQPDWYTYSEAYTLSVLSSSMIQFLTLDDASGTTARDASGNSRTGTYTGTFSLAQIGGPDFNLAKHVNLNATGEIDGYSAGLAGAFNSAAGMISMWVKPNDAAYWTDANTYVAFFVGVSSTMYVKLSVASSLVGFQDRRGGTFPLYQAPTPRTARWVHFACTWDTANDRISLYINGTKGRPVTGMGTWSGSLASSYVRYGDNSPAISNNPWPGRMCLVGMTNSLPSEADIWRISRSTGQIVFDGDSRSNAKLWTVQALETAFADGELCYGGRGYASWAVSGQTTSGMISGAADIDALVKTPGLNCLVVWCGVNDSGSLTAAQIYANLESYCLSRRAAGWDRILICTEIDAQGAVTASWHTTTYPGLNTLLRADYGFADGLIDLGADSRLQDATNLTYFNADQVHPTDAGYQVIASIAAPVIAAVAI